jgi:hypothetical protein
MHCGGRSFVFLWNVGRVGRILCHQSLHPELATTGLLFECSSGMPDVNENC